MNFSQQNVQSRPDQYLFPIPSFKSRLASAPSQQIPIEQTPVQQTSQSDIQFFPHGYGPMISSLANVDAIPNSTNSEHPEELHSETQLSDSWQNILSYHSQAMVPAAGLNNNPGRNSTQSSPNIQNNIFFSRSHTGNPNVGASGISPLSAQEFHDEETAMREAPRNNENPHSEVSPRTSISACNMRLGYTERFIRNSNPNGDVSNPYADVVDPRLTNEESRDGGWPDQGWTHNNQQSLEIKTPDMHGEESATDESSNPILHRSSKRSSQDEKASVWNDVIPRRDRRSSESWFYARKRRQDSCKKLFKPHTPSHSPLHYAIGMDNINRVKQLLQTDNPNFYHKDTGETPLHLACRLGRLEIVKLLRRHPGTQADLPTVEGPKMLCKSGLFASDLARDMGHGNIVEFLGNYKSKDNTTPIISPDKVYNGEREALAMRQVLIETKKTENKKMRIEVDKLRPRYKTLDEENIELKKKLSELVNQEIEVMGKKLPREKPTDTRELATVLSSIRELEQELTQCQEEMWSKREVEILCTVCTENPRSVVLVPCGHFFCSKCAESATKCPKCQAEIESRLKINE